MCWRVGIKSGLQDSPLLQILPPGPSLLSLSNAQVTNVNPFSCPFSSSPSHHGLQAMYWRVGMEGGSQDSVSVWLLPYCSKKGQGTGTRFSGLEQSCSTYISHNICVHYSDTPRDAHDNCIAAFVPGAM